MTVQTPHINFTGPCHHLRPYDGAKRLVIFFGAKDLSFDKYNFFQTGRELPEHCLFINNGVNHWYQYGVPGIGSDMTSTVATIRQWAEMLDVEEIVTIGTSMGGYGAIQYGASLEARVLTFATDAHLGARHSQSARYFLAEGAPSCPDLCALLAKTPTDVTLFAGERDAPDLYAAWQLAQLDCVNAISLVGADHILPSYLSQRARLGPLLRSFVSGNGIPQQPDAGDALTSKGYVQKTISAFEAAEEKDWIKCKKDAQAALKAYPHGEAASILLGRALVSLELFKEAVIALGPAVVSQSDDIETKMLLASALRHRGAIAQARQLHHQIIVQQPGAHRSWYALCILALKVGDLKEAMRTVRKAVQIAPKNKSYSDRLDNISARSDALKK
jgi:tetratricopeptide (TPR) repeat protein